MNTIFSQVNEKINLVWNEESLDKLAKLTGLIKRCRKIRAKSFLESMLLLRLDTPKSSLSDWQEKLIEHSSCHVSRQALEKKCRRSLPDFLKKVIETLMEELSSQAAVKMATTLPGVESIQVADSSEIRLHDQLKSYYPHTRHQGAALKLQAQFNALNKKINLLAIRPHNEPDQQYKIKPKQLWLVDLGYFCIKIFNDINEKKAFFVSRFHKGTNFYNPDSGQYIDLKKLLNQCQEDVVDLQVALSKKEQFKCRLVALRLTPEMYQKRLKVLKEKYRKDGKKQSKFKFDSLSKWTILITNLSSSVTPKKLYQLYRLRWQIELLFKMMKQYSALKKIEHRNPDRALGDIYLSLLSALLLSAVIMTSKCVISACKAGKLFYHYREEFIRRLSQKDKTLVNWFRGLIERYACKAIRPHRPSSYHNLLTVNDNMT